MTGKDSESMVEMIQLGRITVIGPESTKETLYELARQLKGAKIPKDIVKKTGIERLDDITEPWLIVVCAPDTPGNAAIEEKISEFISQGRFRNILTLLASGTPEESFPEALLHERLADGTVVDHEPLAANIAGASVKEAEKKLKVERLRLLAPILGVSFDELMNRRRRARMRILTLVFCAVIAGALCFLAVSLYRVKRFSAQNRELAAQYTRTDEAKKNAEESRDAALDSFAATIGTEAAEILARGDTELAMLLCLEFLPERSGVPEVTETFEKALIMRCAKGYVPVTADDEGNYPEKARAQEDEYDADRFRSESGLTESWYYENGDYVISSYEDKEYVYAKDPLRLLFTFENEHTREVEDYTFDYIVMNDTGQKILRQANYFYDLDTGELLTHLVPEYAENIRPWFSAEGYVPVILGKSKVSVIDPMNREEIASFTPPFYPVTEVVFAGERDELNDYCSADALVCSGIRFIWQEEAVPIPDDLEGKTQLARTLLGERTLSEEERERYLG